MALLLPARLRAIEAGLNDAVRQHLSDSGFSDVDASMTGQLVQLRWHGDPSKATSSDDLHADLTRAADSAMTARPGGWPFSAAGDWSDWATQPVIVAVADQDSVPNLPPPPPAVATETDPRLAEVSSESASALSAALAATTASSAPPVVSASASAAASCTQEVTTAISGRHLHFVSSSAELTADSQAVLDDVYKVIRGCPAGLSLEIDGYTDNVGPAKANLTLSFERARAAAAGLVKRGLPKDMVNAHGFGPENPTATNGSEAGRAANRRVVFVLRPA